MVSKDGQATCFLDKNVKIKNGVDAVNKYPKKIMQIDLWYEEWRHYYWNISVASKLNLAYQKEITMAKLCKSKK